MQAQYAIVIGYGATERGAFFHTPEAFIAALSRGA
jgi:hypothetical protein